MGSDTQMTVEIILAAFEKNREKYPESAAEDTLRELGYAARAIKAVSDYEYRHFSILRAVLGLEPEENT